MGGSSAERGISLITGKAVLENLDKNKYQATAIDWDKNNKFYLIQKNKKTLFNLYDFKKFDIVFLALHGPGGEDGKIQGLLDVLGVKYTGSRVLSSALAMSKVKSAQVYKNNNLLTPNFVGFQRGEWFKNEKQILNKEIKYPCVVKASNQGSSYGIFICKTKNNITKTITESLKYSNEIMVQEYMLGREATCGVLEKNNKPFALPPTEIIANAGEFYDFKSKYGKGGSTHVCPAIFPQKILLEIKKQAIIAHQILGCRGMSRTDFFIVKNKVYINETNTIPGMTSTSLLPEAASKAGISFTSMLDLVIKSSV